MTIRPVCKLSCLALALLAILCPLPASAIFAPSPSVPTERLINNIGAYLKDNPEDAQAHYLLARVHYMSFINRLDHVRANDPGSAEKLPRLTDPRQSYRPDGEKISEEKAIGHAEAAFASFHKAIELDENNALYHLGLAGLYEQSAKLAEKIDDGDHTEPKPDDEEQAPLEPPLRFIQEAVSENDIAYRLDREAALATDSVFLPFYPVAYEAGKAYMRLVIEHKLRKDDEVFAQINADLKAIDSKPKAITPIVFRIEGGSPSALNELIADDIIVKFDLDADGVAERRPWVNPDTAILVWDPDSTGTITTGEQLFGNMTFRMLFSDGYRALDSLDDDRDGQLAGDELTGLALWHDRNTNGVSDPGEVTPIGDSPVRSINTRADNKQGIHLMNKAGLTLDDGSTRPTWDWIIPGLEDVR